MPFREKLKALRSQAGATQEQLAQQAGIPLGTVRNYEQGIRQPTWPAVVKLALALGVSADAFSDCDEVKAKLAPKKTRKRK